MSLMRYFSSIGAVIILCCFGLLWLEPAYGQSLTLGFGDTETPPRKWKKEGIYTGSFFDVMREVASRSNIEITLTPYPYKRLLFYLQNGKIDGAVGIFKTNDREKIAIYLDIPISSTSMHFFVKKEKGFEFNQLSNLSGKVVGKVRGVSISGEFEQAARVGMFKIDEVASYKQLIDKLLSDRIDLFAAPTNTTKFHLKENKLGSEIIMLLPSVKPSRSLYLAFSKIAFMNPEKQALVEKIRQVLIEMERENIIENINQGYTETEYP